MWQEYVPGQQFSALRPTWTRGLRCHEWKLDRGPFAATQEAGFPPAQERPDRLPPSYSPAWPHPAWAWSGNPAASPHSRMLYRDSALPSCPAPQRR